MREVLGWMGDRQLAQTSRGNVPCGLFLVFRIFEKWTPENVSNAFQLCVRTVCYDLIKQLGVVLRREKELIPLLQHVKQASASSGQFLPS
jgi:hypothetical protein